MCDRELTAHSLELNAFTEKSPRELFLVGVSSAALHRIEGGKTMMY